MSTAESHTDAGLQEIERKYLVDPGKFPPDLAEALRKGTHHPDIKRRGRITQLYLPVKQDLVRQAIHAIMLTQSEKSRIPAMHREFFSNPDNVSEVRILQRENSFVEEPDPQKAHEALKECYPKGKGVAVPDGFQITIKGKTSPDGVKRPNLETEIQTGKHLCRDVAELIETAKSRYAWEEDGSSVEKMWYDINVPYPGDHRRTCIVELDIFPDLYYMSVAEIEAKSESEMRHIDTDRPKWLGTDVTDNPEMKVRNLAGRRDVSTFSDDTKSAMKPYVGEWMQGLYQPSILGEGIQGITDQIRDKTFVVVGSFIRWLPHVRRITQDLARRCRSVYPHISTLDVARRQGMYNQKNPVFRIEEEIMAEKLVDAENNYVRQIRNRDGIFIVAPEGRLGESSGREAVEAFFCGKDMYVSGPIDNQSSSLGGEVGDAIAQIRKQLQEKGIEDVQHVNITPHIEEVLTCTPGQRTRIRNLNMALLLQKAEEGD